MFAKIVATYRYFMSVVPFRLTPAIITTVVLVTLLLTPTPAGLKDNAWDLVAIFLTTIVAIILKVMPIGVMAMMAIVIVSLAQVTSNSSKGAIADALSSFDSPLIWLIVVAILISRGLKKTGLGSRIGLMFIALLGKRTVGIGYGLAICELVLAPFTPSNTARGGGIVHPIMRSIAGAFDSDPANGTQGKVGTYLALVNYHANPITSAMFVTATAPNPLVVDYVAKASGQSLHLSWTTWALCMLLPGLVCLLLMPLVIRVLCPPELKATPNAIEYARGELARMGPLGGKERVMIGVFAMMLVLWANVPAMIWGPTFTLDPTVVAFLGLFALIITGTIDWDDVLSEKSAWDTLIWFGALVMLAEQLNKLGVIAWFSADMRDAIAASGMGWLSIAAILVLAFVFSHYLFASTTAHISAMMLAFLTVGAQLIPSAYIAPFMLMMAAGSAIMMTLTHYATGTSPIIFGSGYVTMGQWWRVGAVMCVFELVIFAVVGGIWWKILGFW
ncbi:MULTISPECIES: DASS family sodium-coupled anion symporter [Cupriavidus]|jgi:divalent anion:Na+ symporter, DASS family|uniref:DASS family sodium-coupled anion symporter n=1 Tax=Cupriavidus metallidurans TaxID=119219 RepID=A0A132HJE6_9BURK|nr:MULTISPECIES: DASS family sodium-coupled anion symporter [Cupriavidus]KWR82738.1 C4-dicarboxylate ABC transporter [Cupriavidus sp. SHE]KWW36785.1 putative malate transporter YflS [Cupriavidus metallidurans]QBP11624.1 DASS family sodium-coupled anion symporter [Cupriavidus metallidurans]QWC90209.1 DASS family sodium-coupled anion symporter [Cupriavidus metallidurans]